MFQDLLGTQVCCYKDGKLNYMAMDCLSFMYPTFKKVKTEFDIFPGDPFIYVGDIKWLNKIQKYKEPHILVSSTGEYDLTDRKTLLELAYSKHQKNPPKYLIDSGIYNDWTPAQFLNNWKYIWLLGQPLDKIQEQNNVFFQILSSVFNPNGQPNPLNMIQVYTQALEDYGADTFKYYESYMLSFIKKSRKQDELNTKNKTMLLMRNKYLHSYDQFTHDAISNYLHSSIDYEPLKFLNFLLDIVWAGR